jgi:hypothetical protein
MATTSKNLVLTFGKTDGSSYNMTVADYKDGITDAQIKTGAEAIVTQGIFAPAGVGLQALAAAQRVDKTVTDVNLAG